MTPPNTRDSGLEVHQASLAVAYVAPDHGAEVMYRGTIGTRQCDLDPLIRQLPSKRKHLVLVYAAGPGGYWLSRSLRKKGVAGWVVAPSLIPNKTGDRLHTDRRDAGQRARLRRSGDLTPVYVPQVEADASRDLSRAPEDPIRDLKAATFRLNAFLLRQDIRSTGQATWGPAHLRWLSDVGGATPAPPLVFQADVRAVNAHTERLPRLEQARHEPGHPWRLHPGVEALQALRGVQWTGAVTSIAALGARTRVDHPRQLMSSLGLTPSEDSRGERRRQGAITKTGNTQARHALGEGAWAYRDPAQVRRHVPLRLEKLPQAVQDSSGKAHVRLGTRDRKLRARGKQANHVVGALARARIACMWAIAQEGPVTPSQAPIVLK
jgi:transposase